MARSGRFSGLRSVGRAAWRSTMGWHGGWRGHHGVGLCRRRGSELFTGLREGCNWRGAGRRGHQCWIWRALRRTPSRSHAGPWHGTRCGPQAASPAAACGVIGRLVFEGQAGRERFPHVTCDVYSDLRANSDRDCSSIPRLAPWSALCHRSTFSRAVSGAVVRAALGIAVGSWLSRRPLVCQRGVQPAVSVMPVLAPGRSGAILS